MSLWSSFKAFIQRGSVVDLAVGFVIGAAFTKIVTSLTADIIMPPIGLLLGKVDFSGLFINLSGKPYSNLAQAKAANAATINYGSFINAIVEFLIVALAMFFFVQLVTRLLPKPAEPPAAATRECPYCLSAIPAAAQKCAHCTADLRKAA